MASKKCLKGYGRSLKRSRLSRKEVNAANNARAQMKDWDKKMWTWPRQTGKTLITSRLIMQCRILAAPVTAPHGYKKIGRCHRPPTLNKHGRGRSHYKFVSGIWELERQREMKARLATVQIDKRAQSWLKQFCG